jgi:hypothetical protein
MGEDVKTIKQIADELGVSKEALRKRMSREPLKSKIEPHILTKDSTKYLTDIGVDIIMDRGVDTMDKRGGRVHGQGVDTPMSKTTKNTNTIANSQDGQGRTRGGRVHGQGVDTGVDTSIDKLCSILQIELESKNKQLEAKDRQIEELNARLSEVTELATTAQRLHAGTIQQQLTTSTEVTATECEPLTDEPETPAATVERPPSPTMIKAMQNQLQYDKERINALNKELSELKHPKKRKRQTPVSKKSPRLQKQPWQYNNISLTKTILNNILNLKKLMTNKGFEIRIRQLLTYINAVFGNQIINQSCIFTVFTPHFMKPRKQFGFKTELKITP